MQHHKSHLEKEQHWAERVRDYLQKIKENGRRLDPEIAEMLMLFNELGITAFKGFIGAIEQAPHAPYIMICRNDLDEEQKVVRQAWREADTQEKLKQIPQDEIHRLFREARRIANILTCKHLEERSILLGYLTSFYADREVPYDRCLTLQDMQDSATLESQGAQFQVLASPEVRLQKLQEYQQEMREFIGFLKEIYFSREELLE